MRTEVSDRLREGAVKVVADGDENEALRRVYHTLQYKSTISSAKGIIYKTKFISSNGH